ncbi:MULTISPECIES: site-specific DNA-methyltransferase [unclassified Sphingopyxis]|uniref:DNA-methyltransferase n=1 Tax=unclassified Sphingopyxis TaxID=2614943 RepID=UPI00285F2F27|nr:MULTISPECIES: site-specific DNA-methyltransferase [unclassified Sphingopyxis]MDR7062489.1 site-specific DNA-methyltransferase (cytosine-N4-specific) [Sphingopyxis sp. BE235]MDR7182962.1 site-specific DNA-methyltransferase (cytosine-N4-specific) [Sphingopyxis sp. BE249]
MGRPKANKPRSAITNVRLTEEEKETFDAKAIELGFSAVSEYIRFLHNQHVAASCQTATIDDHKLIYPKKLVRSFHRTEMGEMMWGDSRAYLFNGAKPDSVDLIMTSPPFGLVRKKSYGNEDADAYCNWFRPFAEGFKRVLKDDGSLVIDIGGAWVPGQPTRSLYHFKLLVMLVEEYGFHLCQEHYWWNPAKLPTPAEWVNVRRVRVKDAVNTVWWLSKTPFPKANNRRILAPYSKSMKDLLRNGYTAKMRPSGHDISDKFMKDNGGSVPPNLLAIANTESTSRYQEHCRDNNIPIHPARFPPQLPEYFIRFLTEPGDMVLDPFGGSCVTGAVAEALGRNWICCEMSEEYLNGALARFVPHAVPLLRDRPASYEIAPPCAVPVDEEAIPLFADGGAARPPAMPSKPALVKSVKAKVTARPRGGQPTRRVASA